MDDPRDLCVAVLAKLLERFPPHPGQTVVLNMGSHHDAINEIGAARLILAAAQNAGARELSFVIPVELPDGRIVKMRPCDLRDDDMVAFIDSANLPASQAPSQRCSVCACHGTFTQKDPT